MAENAIYAMQTLAWWRYYQPCCGAVLTQVRSQSIMCSDVASKWPAFIRSTTLRRQSPWAMPEQNGWTIGDDPCVDTFKSFDEFKFRWAPFCVNVMSRPHTNLNVSRITGISHLGYRTQFLYDSCDKGDTAMPILWVLAMDAAVHCGTRWHSSP